MAAARSPVSVASSTTPASPFLSGKLHPWNLKMLSQPFTSIRTSIIRSVKDSSSSSSHGVKLEDSQQSDQEFMSIDALQRFIQLNLGNWTGSFHQFDGKGKLMNQISTRLAASSYGEDELVSLIQTLYIKQPQSTTLFSGTKYDEPEWSEYKIKETNMFTVDKYQQIGFFPRERAFALRYQTAGMLETVLRQGVLGEDDTGEESPKNLKLPSRRPSVVCENCLYSLEKDRRVRAFHILDPKGILEMLLVFLEERGGTSLVSPTFNDSQDDINRLTPHLGKWRGHSITKRSGVYGATLTEADTVSELEIDKDGQLIQDVSSTSDVRDVTTNVHWTGKVSNNLVTFDGGYQLTLLPGGIYMGCPCDVAKCVQESKSFHLELCWLESPGKRQRLVRTYDVEGLAVSSTYFLETKV
ncbi:OLC1v1009657C1 [Oldenlandia corymbosa var. corymbosa]|uniref:OLC1v1009657C1 n=1 Tax=Oldenlandia corymbosa var. corymbosa TaxID=529605 RepID=A0AAV1DRV0_OLDCO|nr:OLC1v1009657C1 [Oldenlandia corymbosa var. corymbosa]